MGKYDVIRTGNIYLEQPSFWKAASDVLEKYLDPEYQNRLKQQEEEKNRYEDQLLVDKNERIESKRRYDQEYESQEKQRRLENKQYVAQQAEIKRTTDLNEINSNVAILNEESPESVYKYLTDESADGSPVDPDFVNAYEKISTDHKNWQDSINEWYGFKTREEKLAYWDTLQASAQAAGTTDQLDKIRPQHEKLLKSQEYKNISTALTRQFPELVDTNVLSMLQSGTMSHEGLKSVAGIIDNALEKQGVLDDRKQSLAELLIGYGSDLDLSLATDSQLEAKNRANQLGFAMMEKLAGEGPGDAVVDYSGKLVPSGLYTGYQKDLKDLLDSDTVVVGGKRMTGSQFKEGKNRNLFSKEELAEMKIFDKNIRGKGFFYDKGRAKQLADLSGRKVYDNKGKESSIKTVVSGPSRAEFQAAPFWGPHIARDYPKVVVVEDGVEKEYSVPKFNEKFSLVDPEVEVPRKPDEDLLRQIDKKALEYGYTSKSTPAELEDIKYKILQEFPEYEMK